MIRELCEERQEGVLMAPPSSSGRRKSAPNPKAPSLNMSTSPMTQKIECLKPADPHFQLDQVSLVVSLAKRKKKMMIWKSSFYFNSNNKLS
jgi:hypothetical protein